jgi:replicative DNA helicase
MLEYDDSKEHIELENAVLGALIFESWAFDLVHGDLKWYCFEEEKNQLVYKAICTLKERKDGVDYLTISKELKTGGHYETVGGMAYVMSLTDKIASASNIETHARIIIQRHLERKIKEICQYGLIKLSDRGIDVFDVFDDLKKKLDETVSDVSGNKSFETIDTLAQPFIDDINNKKEGIIPPSITYGLIEVDKYGGVNNSDLIYVGARPGMGKTAFVVKALRNCVFELKKPAGIFSIEMKASQLLTRIASAECQINGEDLRTGNVTHAQINSIHKRINELKKAPLYIDDKTKDIEMLCSKARKMKRDHKIEELVIDYLGLISAKGFRDKNSEITKSVRRNILKT